MSSPGARAQHNLAAIHEAIAERLPHRECIVFRDRRLTYADVARRSRQLAHALHQRGFGARPTGRIGLAGHESHHDHLAIYAHNGNEYLETMLGAYKARVVPINVNYRYVADELRYLLRDSAATAIVYHSAFAPTLAAVLPDVPGLRALFQIDDGSGNDLLPDAEWYEDVLAAAPDVRPAWADEWSPDDRYILYTGGTTGMPKGVIWRQGDIHRTAMGGRDPSTREPWPSLAALAESAASNPSPHVVCAAPPFMHGAGHWTAFMAMNLGWTLAVQDEVTRFDPSDICRLIEREGVTYLQIVGDAFGRPLVEEMERCTHDLTSLRTILSGGAALTPAVAQRFLARLPDLKLIETVGSSEGGGQATHVSTAGSAPTTATYAPVEGSVVVSADRGHVLIPGDDVVGWLAKRGHDIPIGYLGDPEKTANTFPTIAGERMSVPGDRARWLADGTIQLLGRDAVTINSGGEKIFAEEVETAVAAHPDVADVIVTARPSERWGQEVVAIVCLRDDATATGDELAAEAAQHISRYKLPKAWLFVDAIERSPAGKADYRWAIALAAGEGDAPP